MAGKVTIKIEGLRELDAALGQLPKSTARGVLRRILKEAGEPIARAARSRAPTEELFLRESIDVSTQLNDRQRSLHRERGGLAFQEMFVGTNDPAGTQQEFGNRRHGAQPFMRPAWDATKRPTLDLIANSLWTEIEKTAQRVAKRAAKGK
jgi:HK97 gp10 family phage protein